LEAKNLSISKETVDELLEAIWTCRETGQNSVQVCLDTAHANVKSDAVETLYEMGLVSLSPSGVEFTEKGEIEASKIIRRHRLAERLLVDVLGMTADQAEEMACTFEHSVVPHVTDGICTLLGHPKECPHGKPIPSGLDCMKGSDKIKSVLQPLSEVNCSRTVRVAYVRSQDHHRLHQLLSLGFNPGTQLRIHQRTPVLVVQLDGSEFAMDQDVASDVYVWITS
jgi:DtxR family Mn-dependent transcriptional regulator